MCGAACATNGSIVGGVRPQSLRPTAGISGSATGTFMDHSNGNNNNGLQRLCLENLGLNHVTWKQLLVSSRTIPLIRLDLPQNPHIGVAAWEAVAKIFTNVQCTCKPVCLTRCAACATTTGNGHGLAAAYINPLRDCPPKCS
jgi:hypothetical protein